MSNLEAKMKSLRKEEISDEEITLDCANFLSFCDLLLEIENERQTHNQPKNVNDLQYDNNRSKN